MNHVIRSAELQRFPNRTIRFEGVAHGSQVSMFLVDNGPGEGPGLHVHPYSETWVVRHGEAEFTVGTEKLRAGAGDIVVGPPDTPHRFRNVGKDRLKLVCIHASERIIQQDLE